MYYGVELSDGTLLEHHGIKGMHWGVRKYQNEDGSLTPAGRSRYSGDGPEGSSNTDSYGGQKKKGLSKGAKVAIGAAAVAGAAAAIHFSGMDKKIAEKGRDMVERGKVNFAKKYNTLHLLDANIRDADEHKQLHNRYYDSRDKYGSHDERTKTDRSNLHGAVRQLEVDRYARDTYGNGYGQRHGLLNQDNVLGKAVAKRANSIVNKDLRTYEKYANRGSFTHYGGRTLFDNHGGFETYKDFKKSNKRR